MSTQDYNAHDHLIKIRGKDGQQKDYLPAAWRLYELNLRYPNANFSSELLLLDVERNLVVVKCRLYLGANYEASDKKTEALKSGSLSTLDKVETAAKARCARDFGISTELALDMAEDDVVSDETPTQPTPITTAGAKGATPKDDYATTLKTVMDTLKGKGVVTDTVQWMAWKKTVLGADIPNNKLSGIQITQLYDAMLAQEREKGAA